MKLYLDDVRIPPEGWALVSDAHQMIYLLEKKDKLKIDEISLDHDLGNEIFGNGYDVLLWIEEKVFTENYKPPIIHIHTANVSARKKMELALNSIKKFLKE